MRNSVDANPYISASLLEKLAGYKIYLVCYDVAKTQRTCTHTWGASKG